MTGWKRWLPDVIVGSILLAGLSTLAYIMWGLEW